MNPVYTAGVANVYVVRCSERLACLDCEVPANEELTYAEWAY